MALNSGTNNYLFFMQEMEEQPVSTYRVQSGLRITAAALAQQTDPSCRLGTDLAMLEIRHCCTGGCHLQNQEHHHPPRSTASLSLNIPRLDTLSCLPACTPLLRKVYRKEALTLLCSLPEQPQEYEVVSELSKIKWASKPPRQEHKD